MCEIEEVSNNSNSNFPPSVEIDGNIQQIEPSNQNEQQINHKKRNIFEVTLSEPRAKKGRKRHELKQPLPIPIETLTGVKADDSLWRFYKGKYLSRKFFSFLLKTLLQHKFKYKSVNYFHFNDFIFLHKFKMIRL